MFKKLLFATGLGAGYVLGAKAGTQRYEEIVGKARELAGMPAVQGVASNLTEAAGSVADAAKAKTNDTITGVNDAVSGSTTSAPEVVDLTPGVTVSGYDTGAAPMTGAAASDTV